MEDIERAVGNKFEWRGAPQRTDVMAGCGMQCAEQLQGTDAAVIPYFEEAADELIATMGAKKALCAALAHLSGFTEKPTSRSLLSSSDGMITIQFHSGKEIPAHGYVFGKRFHLTLMIQGIILRGAFGVLSFFMYLFFCFLA